MKGPLEGIVVIDLTRILSGPWCTHILADLGARVIKVENPNGGDDSRRLGELLDKDVAHHPSIRSAYFVQPNVGKESIALDLKKEADRDVFEQLLVKADVLIENFKPGVMKRLGYDFGQLHARFPMLVMASISGFGQTGPWSKQGAVDTIIQAMSGLMSVTGHPGAEWKPTRTGASISDSMAGMYAANGIQAALLGRYRTGMGSHVDIAMLDVSIAAASIQVGEWHATGRDPQAIGNRNPVATPFDVFRCADDAKGPTFLCISGAKDTHFQSICQIIGRPDLAAEPRYQTNRSRCEAGRPQELQIELERGLATKSAAAWEEQLVVAGAPYGLVHSISEMAQHPQVRARGMVLPTPDGRFMTTGSPFKIYGYDAVKSRPHPPVLDGDRTHILKDFGIQDPRSKL